MGAMTRHIVRWGLACALMWGHVAAIAASPFEVQRPVHFTRLDGLSHNTVLALLHGQRGFLWIGTADGLNRYDGYDFTVYRHAPSDSASLSGNTVQALAQDEQGRLWVGTAQGLNRLNPETGAVVRHMLEPHGPKQNIAKLFVDGRGALWAWTYEEARLYRRPPGADRFTRIPLPRPQDTPLPDGTVVHLPTTDARGQVWVPTEANGTCRLHRFVEARSRWRSTEPFACRTGATGRGRGAHFWIDAEASATPSMRDSERTPASLASLPDLPAGVRLRRIVEDRAGRVWMGTERGIYRYEPSTETLRHHPLGESGTPELSNYVWAIHEDRAGILWVGTRSGLYRYDPHVHPFRHIVPIEERTGERVRSAIMAIHEDAQGALYLGTLGRGVLRLRRARRGSGDTYSVDDAPIRPGANVWALDRARNGGLWAGTDEGACRIDRRAQVCTAYPMPAEQPSFVYALEAGTDGVRWLGGADLFRLRPGSNPAAEAMGLRDVLRTSTIQAIQQDPHRVERLWLGTEGKGLLRYNVRTGAVTPYPVGDAARSGLSGHTVWTIRPGADSTLWLGTDRGLVRFHPARGTFRSFYAPDVVPGSIVYSILTDARDYLWLGTNQGLVRFDPQTERFRRFGTADGVQNREFNRRAAFQSAEGTFYVAGLQGLTAFAADAIQDNPYVPPVVITEMTKEDQDGPVALRALGRDHVVLDYRDRVFTVTFAALNFTNPHQNQYTYQLSGFEDGWVEAGTRRTVRYTNVPPGEYVFRVRGTNNDGVWNEEGASIRVTIMPPFWQTGWFRVLIGALLVGAVVLAYRLRVRHLLEVERLRLRIASDLHDDVASQLASVAISSDVLRATADLTADEHAELRRMGRLVRETTETLRDIVWFVDPEHDRPEALLWKMKNEASALLNGVAYTFEHPEPERLAALEQLDVRRRRNLFLIYKEALHNIVRHARAETVQITLCRQTDRFELTITDDGIGFDPEAEDAAGQGLSNMRRRAAQMQADLTLTSHPAPGTTLRLVVPLA